MTLTRPARLRPGDTVAVVAPSGPVDRARLERSLPLLADRYDVRVAGDLYARDGFLAGSDRRRADELNAALRDRDVRAIIFARGGYGATRILGDLDAAALRDDPIPLVGFSDTTALLGWAAAAAGVASIHGPVAAQLAELETGDVERLFAMLESPEPAPPLSGLERCGARGEKTVEGPLWGGNLSMIAHLLATPDWPDPGDGAILFFEDVGERPYAIDRYLTRIAAAGALDRVAGAVVGDLVGCVEPKAADHPSAVAVVDERLAWYAVAGLRGAPFGHGDRNAALAFGGRVRVDLADGVVEPLEGAVQ
jgi:muramoyltetrapeptide carboxypeptidase